MSSHSTSFHCNVDEMPLELSSCFYQLAFGKIGFIMFPSLKVAEPTNDIK